jgi:hypothetical protein
VSDISDSELDALVDPVPPRRRKRATKVSAEPEQQSLREMLGQVMEETATLDAVRALVQQTMSETHRPTVHCPECGNEFRPPVGDLKKRLDSVISLLEQVEGKAGAMPPASTLITILRPPLG